MTVVAALGFSFTAAENGCDFLIAHKSTMPHSIEATFSGSSVVLAKLLLDSEQKVYRLLLCARSGQNSTRGKISRSALVMASYSTGRAIGIAITGCYAWLAGALPSAACAAARRAMGTRNGEHET